MNAIYRKLYTETKAIRDMLVEIIRVKIMAKYDVSARVDSSHVEIEPLEPEGVSIKAAFRIIIMPRKEEPKIDEQPK